MTTVDLGSLQDHMDNFERIQADMDENFRPSNFAVAYAVAYARRHDLEAVFVPVSFPGKRRGFWVEGQPRQTIMDGSFPAFMTSRENALIALDSGLVGNALFRVYADGLVTLVDEK